MHEMEPMTSSKLYYLRSEPCHFSAGRLKDGTQVFLSTDYSRLFAVLFDAQGTYLQALVREVSQETQTAVQDDFMNKGWSKCWDELDRWAAELGFIEGMIALRKFSLPEFEFGIRDLPEVYQELVDSGRELDEDDKEGILSWQEVNDYVLLWGNEYDIGREGEVIST